MPDKKPNDAPPPVRRAGPNRLALISGGALAAVVLLIVILNIDFGGSAPDEPDLPEEVIELIPGPLAKEAPAKRRFDPKADGTMPELSEGGRIQNTDAEGNLAQEYRFRRLDPSPPDMPTGWVHMDDPEAEFYLDDDRVLRLTGDEALAYLPHRVLESGTIKGNVIIRLFEPPPGRVLDITRDKPLLEVHTDEARFDNIIGEVRVPGDFEVTTPSVEFPGRGFTLLINDRDERVALTVEVEHVEFVRLARSAPAARDTTPDAGKPRLRRRAEKPRTPTSPTPTTPATPRTPAPKTPSPPAPNTPAAQEQTQFYRLTLHDDVKIRQGPPTALRTATGNALTIVFSSESQGLATAIVFTPIHNTPPSFAGSHALTAQRQSMRLAGRLALALFAPPIQSLAPPPTDDDILITCTGGMTMVPIFDPAEMLDSPRDARLSLLGRPVRLHDTAQDARAECDRLVYRALEQKIELIGSASQPLTMSAPQLAAGGEAFWIRRTEGGFTGPGWLDMYDPPEPGQHPAVAKRSPQLRVNWTDGVDLAFDEPPDDNSIGDLRRATFRGEVSAADADRTMWADGLAVTFGPAEAQGAPGNQLDKVDAEGNIQILLANGARVFADRLHGNAATETVELLGEGLAIAHDVWLIDDGRRLVLDQKSQTADWEGPGTARRFATRFALTDDRRIAPLVIDPEPTARVRWEGSMRYDQAYDDGAGAIDLHGGVEVVSDPQPLERSTFAARDVTLVLASDDPAESAEANRRLGRVIARGDARLERRDWTTEDHTDEPRIFFVSGQRIEYDDQTGEALVPGAGELLIRDVRPVQDESASPLGTRGTTSFRWRQKLQMTRRSDTLYDITMLEGIEMRHLSPDQQSATLTCDRIDATIDRAEPQLEVTGPDGDLIGGPTELVHLRAEGKVFLHTDQRDIDCHVFDYDVKRGIADLSAAPGGFVVVMTVGAPAP
ncbi:MAG: hypothetical protein ACYSU7_15075, partial [Planctomycetota bacterium]